MNDNVLREAIVPLVYLFSAALFIFGLKRMSRVKTARSGSTTAAVAMLLAVVGTLLELGRIDYRWIIGGLVVGGLIGTVAAVRVQMTSMPEMVALFNGLGGASSALVGLAIFWWQFVEEGAAGTVADVLGIDDAITIALSIIIGTITLTGSLVAYLKLQGTLRKGKPILLPGRHVLNGLMLVGAVGLSVWYGFFASESSDAITAAIALTAVSFVLGITLVIPIGGADMPVVVSLLNSYSGVAASMAGFVVNNPLLIIAGAMVGAAGLILTQIMCVAMNRSLVNVLVGGFGVEESTAGGAAAEYTNVKSASPEEAAMVLDGAESVIFVPGYGLAVAQAQHIVRELADLLEKRGTKVKYAIHPVAGRMPGHMNVLLAEADVPYEQLVEMDAINPEFKQTDVAIVIGANDVVNPAATHNKGSPIYGMPILEVHEAKTVFVIKRSLGAGYAGIKNELFEYPNTMMIYGDAKQVLQTLAAEVKLL